MCVIRCCSECQGQASSVTLILPLVKEHLQNIKQVVSSSGCNLGHSGVTTRVNVSVVSTVEVNR